MTIHRKVVTLAWLLVFVAVSCLLFEAWLKDSTSFKMAAFLWQGARISAREGRVHDNIVRNESCVVVNGNWSILTSCVHDNSDIPLQDTQGENKSQTKDAPRLKIKGSQDSVVGKGTLQLKVKKKRHRHYRNCTFYPALSCNAVRPPLLLYNRIFKTGSTSFNNYFVLCSKRLGYKVRIGGTEDWYERGKSYPYPDEVIRFSRRSGRQFSGFSGHFYFRMTFPLKIKFTYINLVRDPLERVISHYFYMRTNARPDKRIREMKAAGEWNETLRECFTRQHKGCKNNVMTRFFCGPSKFCREASSLSLERAKRNIVNYYAVVGTLERIDDFIRVLQLRLPDYFANNVDAFPRLKTTKRRNALTPDVLLREIEQANWADRELYDFVNQRFDKQRILCNLSGTI